MSTKKILKYALLGVFGLYLLFMMFGMGWEIVDTGHRGVITKFGKVVSGSLPEGVYFYNPFTSDFQEFDTRVQKWESDTECFTKDVQRAKISFALTYSLHKDNVHKVLELIGKDWANTLLPQVVTGTIKTVTGQWEAVNIVENREKARTAIEAQLTKFFENKYISIDNIEITNIDYDDAFEKAVEDKVVAVQRAVEAQNKTKQIEEESKQRVIAAKAEAESMKIRAQALTQNRSLVQYEAVQKWNGILPSYMMGNSVPFINLSK
jgi:prohibitin 2